MSELYVKMTDEEYEKYKRASKPIESYTIEELAGYLLDKMKKSGCDLDNGVDMNNGKSVTTARVSSGRFDIALRVSK